MARDDTKKALLALLHQVGPTELLTALAEAMHEDLEDSAPPGRDRRKAASRIPELADWQDVVEGSILDARDACGDLESEIGYPPADQDAQPGTRHHGQVVETLFPWLVK